MKPNTLLRRMAVLVATLMCALGANAQEAYACYTESNTTLTFYYDSQRSSREGTTYDLKTEAVSPDWFTNGTYDNVTQVVFDPSFAEARPTTTFGWLYGMTKLEAIEGIGFLNTSVATNMAYMFYYCSGLTSLDLSSFNTSEVTDMSYMFGDCSDLQTVYVGDEWSTDNVTKSDYMFQNCTSLVGGKGTTWNDSNPKDATYAHIDGGASNPGYFSSKAYAAFENGTLTFYYDTERNSRTGTIYDLNKDYNVPEWYLDDTYASVTEVVFDSSFADARPTTTCRWFYEMNHLQSITGMKEYLNTSEVTNMCAMFLNCTHLTNLDVSHFNTANVTKMEGMFLCCAALTSLDLSSFNTANVTDMEQMFYGCENLKTIYVGDEWNTLRVTSSLLMFSECTSLVGGQGTTYAASYVDKAYAHIDGGASNPGYFTTPPEAYACYTSSNTTLTFYYDTQRSSRTGTTYSLNTDYDDPGWYTDGTKSKVTKVVFKSSFADARPTTTYEWFYEMKNLQSITGMEYLNTSEVTNMAWMFANCTSLTSLDLSYFNTSKVTNMVGMFCSCTSLTSLNLSSFNTSKVTEMFNMFNGCYSLNSLNLSSFNTSNVTNMGQMFYGCENLKTIYVGDGWSTDQVTESDNMFAICYNLVGGQGTIFDENHVDATYAHIDEGRSNPGYFSDTSGLVTHIEAVPAKANTVKDIYTLDGRKLNDLPTQKGIYIIDGRRVVIK